MLRFNQLNSAHLEITTRCQASCPMCNRNYRGGIANPNLVISDWTIDDYKKIMTVEVLNQLENVYFCGNLGDPIINDELIEMCEYTKQTNPQMQIRVHTNGSARKTEWWEKLARALPTNHVVLFGIDGLEDTHSIYRIGTSYEKIIENARAFIAADGIAEWVFIKFKHNEHQVDEARRRAEEIGFRKFAVKNSTRFMEQKFAVLDEKGNTVYYLEPPSNNGVVLIDANMIKKFRHYVDSAKIKCYVQETREVYIDAQKNLFPCCFLASTPYNYIEPNSLISPIKEEIKTQYNKLVESLGGIENLNTLNKSVREIVDSTEYQTVWDHYWNDEKLITCVRTCGVTEDNISKPKDQIVERTTFD